VKGNLLLEATVSAYCLDSRNGEVVNVSDVIARLRQPNKENPLLLWERREFVGGKGEVVKRHCHTLPPLD
jgi:hypothetical protein